jgi:hypothetical protein
MKRINYLFALSLGLSMLTSCDSFLDVEPKASISDEQTIFDKASAETALRGVYNAVANSSYYGTTFQSIGYLSGDNIQWTGSQSQVQEFINHKVNAENATVSNAWIAIYATINRANQVIAKVPAVDDLTLTDALKNPIVGEAYLGRRSADYTANLHTIRKLGYQAKFAGRNVCAGFKRSGCC